MAHVNPANHYDDSSQQYPFTLLEPKVELFTDSDDDQVDTDFNSQFQCNDQLTVNGQVIKSEPLEVDTSANSANHFGRPQSAPVSQNPVFLTQIKLEPAVELRQREAPKPKFQGYVRKGTHPISKSSAHSKTAITAIKKSLNQIFSKSSDKTPSKGLEKSARNKFFKSPDKGVTLNKSLKQKNPKNESTAMLGYTGSSLKCDHCRFRTKDKREFQFHQAKHDSTVTVSTCKTCSQRFLTAGALKLHALTHIVTDLDEAITEPIFECHLCDTKRSFSHKGNLRKHLKVVHKAEMLPDEVYSYEDNLKFFC